MNMLAKYLMMILLILTAGLAACNNDRPDLDREPPVAKDEIGITEQQTSLGNISDEEIDKFVEVILRAEVEWTDPDRQFSTMEPMIHEVGLSLNRYIEIQNLIEQEPEVRVIVEQRLENLRMDGND